MTDSLCFECGHPAEHAHHVVPALLGGTKTVPLCTPCHGKAHQSRALALLAKARKAKREATGRCEGRRPFGERPGEQQTIEVMQQLRRRRHDGKAWSYKRIADELNGRGLTGRMGRAWRASSVHDILKRERTSRRKPVTSR